MFVRDEWTQVFSSRTLLPDARVKLLSFPCLLAPPAQVLQLCPALARAGYTCDAAPSSSVLSPEADVASAHL